MDRGEVVHPSLASTEERNDGRLMDTNSSEDSQLKRQTVEAYLMPNQNIEQ